MKEFAQAQINALSSFVDSDQIGADLVVMDTHGHGMLADTMMGSTASRVERRSPVPVLTVRLPE
jgi:nucleotide-binding universal stress UspA family protein